MHYPALTLKLAKAAQNAEKFMAWLACGDELIDAARLLGGRKWCAAAKNVVSRARDGVAIERILPDLRRLQRLLMLEYVNDLDSVEANCFMSVHPDDPRADNARICADALERGIAALELARPVRLGEAV